MFLAALSSELSKKMAIGGKLTLMGILIVFGLLALIVIVLTIMERIMRKSGEKPKKERKNLKELFKNKMQKNAPKPEAVVTPTTSETQFQGVSPEVVAAITAAISAYMGEECEGSNQKFIVRNIKKLSYRR
ncbi:efflux ABC transporter permease protein [Clostridium sp. CAG:349]|nr:efflux ABC transporter permease protein [Clostridium sp. CAG:349]